MGTPTRECLLLPAGGVGPGPPLHHSLLQFELEGTTRVDSFSRIVVGCGLCTYCVLARGGPGGVPSAAGEASR